MTQKYKAGDTIAVKLSIGDATLLNESACIGIFPNMVVRHEPAPIPEPFVVWRFERPAGYLYYAYDPNISDIEKLTLTPTSPDGGTYTVEKVK